eukprot:29876-Pelagococcus_subviridis.AAC.1
MFTIASAAGGLARSRRRARGASAPAQCSWLASFCRSVALTFFLGGQTSEGFVRASPSSVARRALLGYRPARRSARAIPRRGRAEAAVRGRARARAAVGEEGCVDPL